MEFTFGFLASIKRKGLRNKNWGRLRLVERGLFNCALELAKARGKIRNMDLMVKVASIVLKLKATVGARITKLGKVRALELLKLCAKNKVFDWAPRLKEWLKEPSYIFYLGLREAFG